MKQTNDYLWVVSLIPSFGSLCVLGVAIGELIEGKIYDLKNRCVHEL